MMNILLISIVVVFVAGLADAQHIGANASNDSAVVAQIANLLSKFEEVRVPTAYGYDVKLLRAINSSRLKAHPVLLSHGILTSALDWILSGARSLPFELADNGTDVWLLSSREYPNQLTEPGFYNFSFHEMGLQDLPATIDYILKNTGKPQLHYIGHSDGTTSFFAMAAMKPEMNAKIRSMHALAPLAFMSRAKSSLLTLVSDLLGTILSVLGLGGRPSIDSMIQGEESKCLHDSTFPELCDRPLFLLGGYNSNNLNSTLIPMILECLPAVASVHEIAHYAQLLKSGKFRQWDYGSLGNLNAYGSLSPPNYNLEAVTAPVYLHYSDNDWLSSVKDVDELAGKLGNLAGKFRVPKFNHLDYLWAKDADTLLYSKVISLMDRY